ncbi:MAG TPA: hypothetical protein DD664_05940 [Janibacter terrae]|nr:hypothetical protein [Janibacter terrae]
MKGITMFRTVAPAHPHRSPARSVQQHVAHPLEHAPEILLALAAVLIVLAGPVTRALAPGNVAVSALAVVLLVAGVVLAVAAAVQLVRGPR